MMGIRRCVAFIFTAMMALILLVVAGCFEGTSFSCKRVFALPQWGMLLCGAVVLCGIALLMGRTPGRTGKRFWPALVWPALLGVQLVLCFHAYFLTGWDVQGITESAYAIAGGEADIHASYLSRYPNNIPMVLVFAGIIRVLRLLLGNPGLDRCTYVLIACQCVLNTATGMLVHRIAVRETGSRRVGWGAAVVYMGFVGLSPWLMIPYSDSMALFFPTAVVAVEQAHRQGKLGLGAWPLMGLLTALGYLIKPQAAIVGMAVVLLEAARTIASRSWAKGFKRLACMALAFALLAGPIRQAAVDASPIEVQPEKDMGMLHFAMMGLNRETNGIYNYDDMVLSSSAPTREERRAVQLAEIGRRLSSMTPGGMLDHLKKKTLTNYADGTFAWGSEGGFYKEWIADKDAVLSPLLKSFVNIGHENFQILLTYLHSIWLALLLGCVFCGARRLLGGGAERGALDVMMLSIVGLTLFEWIFEARARYLFLYAPFYVMLGMYGWGQAAGFFKRTAQSAAVHS